MIASRDFYEALGTLVYSMAAADGTLQKEELNRYGNTLLNSFGDWDMKTRGLRAIAAFEIHQRLNTSAADAFDEALEKFGYVKAEAKHHRDKIVSVLLQVAAANKTVTDDEKLLLDRFQEFADKL
jgi:uncharacterized tellurite resistance protein B-like protein